MPRFLKWDDQPLPKDSATLHLQTHSDWCFYLRSRGALAPLHTGCVYTSSCIAPRDHRELKVVSNG
jgi:hypothetical protein